MFSNRLAFGALAAACIAAAGVGGYLASRQNAVPAPLSATAAPAGTPVAAPAPRPVQETEGVVGDAPKAAYAAADRDQVTVVTKTPATPAKRDAKGSAKTAARPDAVGSPAAAAGGRQAASKTPAAQAPGTLASSWPTGATAQLPPALPGDTGASPQHAQEPADTHAPEAPQKTFEDLVVSADSVIGLQTEGRITSETARVEDRIEARVTRDVKVGDRVAIPAGSRALGNVTLVERGGKFKERARLGVRFHTLVLADGTRVPISTETIYRDGEAPSNSSAQKIGGAAVGGAILGAILGGAKGAAIGATAGAGGGAAVVAAGDRSEAVLQPGTPMTVRVLAPVTVTIEKN